MIAYAISIAHAIASRRAWFLLAASYLIVGVLASCAGRSAVERRLRIQEALYSENLAAMQDTSRRLLIRVSTLGESLAITERRAMQREQREDALDKALRLERRARVAAVLEVPRVTGKVGGEVAAASDSGRSTDDVRRAHFRLEETWYDGSADVALPRAPGRPALSLDLGMRPIPLEVRISCSARSGTGVAGASASVTAPRWARLTLTSVEQDPAVCSRAAMAARQGLTTLLRERLAVVIGYGITAGEWKPGGVVAAGIRLW